MRSLSIIIILVFLVSCEQTPQKVQPTGKPDQQSTGNFGEKILADKAIAATDLINIFDASDTIETIISGNIIASCKHTGCWMDLDMGNGETVHVTFLDESFTIPLDAAGKNAVAEGTAIRELIPVETLKNYAREEGKSEEEVDAITVPVYAYEFIAKGILIEE
jgi:hypothetical protein